jgi:hypothetical protein
MNKERITTLELKESKYTCPAILTPPAGGSGNYSVVNDRKIISKDENP